MSGSRDNNLIDMKTRLLPFYNMLSLRGLVLVTTALLWLGRAQRVDFPTFKQSVTDSFDDQQPFEANLFEVLAILCPESVYCPGDETSQHGAREYRATFFDGLYGQSTSVNTTSETALEARQVVRENVDQLFGCCQRCSCGQNCHEKQNCCPVIAQDRSQSTMVNQTCIEAAYMADVIPFYGYSYYMVADCFRPSQNDSQGIVRRCKEPNMTSPVDIIPVYSSITDRIYRNKFCAICNNDANNIASFDFIISFKNNWIAKEVIDVIGIEVYAWLMENRRAASANLCFPEDLVKNEADYMCVLQPLLSQMHKSKLQNETSFLEQACLKTDALFYSSSHMYRNIFCRLLSTTGYLARVSDCSAITKKGFGTTFTSILNFQHMHTDESVKSVVSSEMHDEPCTCTQYFDQANERCRKLMCPFAKVYMNCTCTQLVGMVSGLDILVYTEMSPIDHSVEDLILDKQLALAVAHSLKQLLCEDCGSVSTVALINETSSTDPDYFTITAVSVVRFRFGFDTFALIEQLWQQINAGVSFTYKQYHMVIAPGLHHYIFYDRGTQRLEIIPDPAVLSDRLLEIEFSVESYKPSKTSKNDVSVVLSNLLFCRFLKLDAKEVDTLTKLSAAAGYSPNQLRQSYSDHDTNMCIEDYIKIFKNASNKLELSYSLVMMYTYLLIHINI